MTKLYVDDIRDEPDGWAKADTITSAIRFIEQFEPEVISLDHDISVPVSVSEVYRPFPSPECFCPVAYFIKHFYKGKENPKVYIHTSNPEGARDMQYILTDFETHVELAPPAHR